MDCSSQVFFTEAAFEQYSVQPTFLELLQKYAPRRKKANDNFPKNDKGFAQTLGGKQNTESRLRQTLMSPKTGFLFPRYSSLTIDQHHKYLEYEIKYSQQSLQGRHTPQELHEHREFRQYQTSVANEQREYQQFAENVAKDSADDYKFLHPLAEAYIKSTIKQWDERLLKQLSQNYALYQTIGLSVEPVIPSDPVLKHKTCLLSLGQPPTMTIPPVDPHNPPVLHHMVSVKEGASKISKGDWIEIISEDVNAKKLAEKYQANIVVSFSALKSLLNTHPQPFEEQWEIPITVCKKGDGVIIIYIDKPLKQKVIYPHEASEVFHEVTLKQFLYVNPEIPIEVDSRDECVERFLQSGVEFGASNESGMDGFGFGSCATSEADALLELETFGSGLILPMPKKISQYKETVQLHPDKLEKTMDKDITEAGASSSIASSEVISTDSKVHQTLPMERTSVDDVIRDSPQSPDAGNSELTNLDKASGDDLVRDSPLSPDPENAESANQKSSVDDVIRESPQSPDAGDSELTNLDKTSSQGAKVELSEKSVDDLIRDSPLSPDPENAEPANLNKTSSQSAKVEISEKSGDNVITDSPLSPDPENTDPANLDKTSSESANVKFSEKSSEDGVIRDSPQSPDAGNSGLANSDSQDAKFSKKSGDDLITDSPQSPDDESTEPASLDKTLSQSAVNRRESLSNGACVNSPPTPVTAECNRISQNGKHTQNLTDDSLLSPVRDQGLILKDSSASEVEGELIIASPPRIISQDQLNNSDMTEESPSIADKEKSNLSTIRTRRSKRLQVSMLGNHSDSEDEQSGVVTRRRSARLRKADGSPPDRTPVKKIKVRDVKIEAMEVSEEAMKEAVPAVKDSAKSNDQAADVVENSKIDSLPMGQVFDKQCDQALYAKDQSAENVQSSNSKTTVDSKPTKPVDLKRSSSATPVTDTNPAKKSRARSLLKGQAMKNKVGGVSSTIDTIMKLQEALHTRRQQKGPNTSMEVKSSDTKGEPRQNAFPAEPENPEDYQAPKHGNVTYNLWRLGKMNVLIRTRDHGVVSQGEESHHQKFPVTVIPKVEHQTHFGYEQANLSELCQIWSNLFIRPGSKVIRGRVDAMTSQLLKLEWLDLSSPIWSQCPFNPARSMKMVHAIFDKLQGLPQGKYLLSHCSGDSHACVHLALEAASKKRVTYDLHTAHTLPALQADLPEVFPWIPLDPNVLHHKTIEQKTIPLTFPARKPGTKVGQLLNPNPRKKNKGKKKKKSNNTPASKLTQGIRP